MAFHNRRPDLRRVFLGANIPIAHPLVNIETLSSDRVFYYGTPLNVPKLEASFVRAVAFEPQNQEDDA
jgi:kynurenine formamidase